eukprot:scaffold744_cov240-Pinguiococcus_pyrenoidosus.AAC.12
MAGDSAATREDMAVAAHVLCPAWPERSGFALDWKRFPNLRITCFPQITMIHDAVWTQMYCMMVRDERKRR